MRHAILIQAHRHPEQFARLCGALKHPAFDIYANIDKKADIDRFRDLVPDIFYIEDRVDVGWGKWSQVEATLAGMRQIAASGREYGYVNLISGQDYPVRPMDEIARALDGNYGAEYIRETVSPDPKQNKIWQERYLYPYIHIRNKPCNYLVNRLIKIVVPMRKPPFRIVKGSSWWTLTLGTVRYILDFSRDNPDITASFVRTLCPDEMFVQSILFASPVAGRIDGDIHRHIDWRGCTKSPRTLTKDDFEAIMSGNAWFARKLDMDTDREIFDMLDAASGRCDHNRTP